MAVDPTVCAVMLANGRPEMVARAVLCFRAQTYEHKQLVVLDTSPTNEQDWLLWKPELNGTSIGQLRNLANAWAAVCAPIGKYSRQIIMHWDSDDWSHPERIAEQVAMLQTTGADVAGYRDLVFWHQQTGEAWLYTNYHTPPGTTLCYWRKTWERVPFQPTSKGEDTRWLMDVRAAGMKVAAWTSRPEVYRREVPNARLDPRCIALIHGGNTSSEITPGAAEWKRTPEYDQYCLEAFR